MCLSGTLSNQHVMALNHICRIYLPLCFLIPSPLTGLLHPCLVPHSQILHIRENTIFVFLNLAYFPWHSKLWFPPFSGKAHGFLFL